MPPNQYDQSYLHKSLKVGESSYTNYITLKGENNYGAEYYGFSPRSGHWIVIKPDGTEWDDLKDCDDVIICAPDDSAAHLFAMHNGIPFFILMDYPE